MTGLLAANFGRAALDAVGCTSPVARGLAMGAAEGPAPAALTPVWWGMLPVAYALIAAIVGTVAGSVLLPRKDAPAALVS